MEEPRPRISELIPGYRYPRTIAEMMPERRREFQAHAGREHHCPNGHGPMQPRALEGQTYEELYCGLWWDCKHGCTSSGAVSSRDLAYDHGEPYNTGDGWEKFTPAGWVPVTAEEVEAFYARLVAWHDARQPKPGRRRRSAAHRRAMPRGTVTQSGDHGEVAAGGTGSVLPGTCRVTAGRS
jgi:hypothetical protein